MARGHEGRHPRRGARHALPAGHQEPAEGDAAGRRQAVDPVRGRGGGRGRASPTSSSSPGAASARSRTTSTATSSSSTSSSRRASSTCSPRSRPSTSSPTSTTSARREPLGLGHAVSVAREHVGDEPFAVMLGDDIMVDDVELLALDARRPRARAGARCSRCSRSRRDEISSLRLRRARGRSTTRSCGCARSSRSRSPEDAPSNLAVIGRYVFTPEIFDALDRIEPGVGGELQLTDAIDLLLGPEPVFGRVFTDGRYDIGKKLDFLRANVELALDRDDLGPELARLPAEPACAASCGARGVIPLGRGPGRRSSRAVDAARRRSSCRRPMRSGSCSRPTSSRREPVPPFANTAMDGYAVRAADTAGAHRRRAGPAARGGRPAGRPRAHGRRSARARRSAS